MRAEELKRKAVRIVTTPPELVYALSKHWFAITLCLSLGILFTLGKVATDSPLFRAKARLLVNHQRPAEVQRNTGEDGGRFLRSQVAILKSESVLRKLVRYLGAAEVNFQDEHLEAKNYGAVRGRIYKVREGITNWIESLRHPGARDGGEERSVQRAIRSLQRRSFIQPNPNTGIIHIDLYGGSPERLGQELQTWIDAYFQRMNELAKDTYDSFYNSRMEYWRELEQEDYARVLAFKQEHSDVSQEQIDALNEEVIQFRLYHSQLSRRFELEDSPLFSVEPQRQDPKLMALKTRKLEVEMVLSEARVIYQEDSNRIHILKATISRLEEEIENFAVTGGGTPNTPEEKRVWLSRQIARVSAQLKERMARRALLKSNYEDLQDLQRKHKTSKEYREKYSLARKKHSDLTDSDRSVRVTVVDPPSVSTQPLNTDPLRHVLFGSIGGILCGVLLALCLEITTGKIRCKSDIESECALPVIGVIKKA